MADAPKQIWAGPDAVCGWDFPMAEISPDPDLNRTTKYVRADLMPRWHRIDDPEHPAPKDGRLVLLRTESGDEWAGTFTAYWSSSRNLFFYAQDRSVTRATHWQPLPAPPEAD